MDNKSYCTARFIFICFFHFITVTKQLEKTVAKLQHEQKAASHLPHIILISQEFDNPYWRKIEQGAREAGKQNNVNIEYIGPLRTSIKEFLFLLFLLLHSR